MSETEPIQLGLDARRRISLRKLGNPKHTRYLAHACDDGTIILTPAVVMSKFEADLITQRPDIVRRLNEATAGEMEEVDIDRL